VVLYLLNHILKRVKGFTLEILLAQDAQRVATPVAVVARFLNGTDLRWKVVKDAPRAATQILVEREDGFRDCVWTLKAPRAFKKASTSL
jgi:hypothetical protein